MQKAEFNKDLGTFAYSGAMRKLLPPIQ